MSIPHRIRRMAREAYRHTIMTGRPSYVRGNLAGMAHLDAGFVRVYDGEREYRVPIAASWL